MSLELEGMQDPPDMGYIVLFGHRITAYRYDDLNFFIHAGDLAKVLGYSKTDSILKKLKDIDKIKFSKLIKDGPKTLIKRIGEEIISPYRGKSVHIRRFKDRFGVTGGITFISEKGLYDAIDKGETKECDSFNDFVNGVILTSINHTGSYLSQAPQIEVIDTATGKVLPYVSKELEDMKRSLLDGDFCKFLPNEDPFLY